MLFPIKMIMASEPAAPERVKDFLLAHQARENVATPFYVLKSLVSSPRLFDVYWRSFNMESVSVAGDTFLDKYTMLGDSRQKTFAISLDQWRILERVYKDIVEFSSRDSGVSKVQVWSIDPNLLSHEQMKLAVAVTYNDLELLDEPRLCGALNELLSSYNVECYWAFRCYG
ncbi:hypothetical protein [Pseudomonas coronafaciens]|uniref:Uncharacterized protein n=1 Tax=Pseudomonas coronafaciens pv. coronafaciens TaxID=235275 RepID=A0AAE6QJ93_9PSED|nr:hypothetical protein [Pseudomonas coronafaciens]QGT82818.1 hypothetical protein GMO17_17420 [Pseudomonas coronafaciens pv. coronafaciens]